MSVLLDRPEAFEEIKPQEAKSLLPGQTPTQLVALKLVVQDFQKAEHKFFPDRILYDFYDQLYDARVPVIHWEGTTVRRANLGVPLIYEHIESILPQVINLLFLESPPFFVKPLPGTSMDAARGNSFIMARQLRQVGFREQIRLIAKSALLYGTGAGKWGWLKETRKRTRVTRVDQPSVTGTGDTRTIIETDTALKATQEDVVINQPTFEAIDIRRLFVDPSLRGPNVRKSKFVIEQSYMTIGQLDALRADERYTIPPQDQLVALFFPPKEPVKGEFQHSGASTSTSPGSEFTQIFSFDREFAAPLGPADEVSVDPLLKPLEVLERWTGDKVITVLQRKLVIRNEANELNAIPYVTTPFSDVLNKHAGMGIGKLVGPEQRLQQGIINSRLDDLALLLNGMATRVRGANVPSQQVRMRPGGVIDSDTPDGIRWMDRKPAIPEAFAEIEASDRRAQRRTAASEIAVQGSIPANTSLTRTATGVNTLAGGAGARLEYFINNLADLVYIPALEAFTEMNRTRLSPKQVRQILSEDLAESYLSDVVDILDGRFQFEILAASKLQARRAMAQSLPLLLNFLLNGDIISALADQGKKVEFQEILSMVYEVSGWPNKQSVVVDMTDEERAAHLASKQALAQAAQQQSQQKADSELVDQKQEGQAGLAVVKSILEGAGREVPQPKEGGQQ